MSSVLPLAAVPTSSANTDNNVRIGKRQDESVQSNPSDSVDKLRRQDCTNRF